MFSWVFPVTSHKSWLWFSQLLLSTADFGCHSQRQTANLQALYAWFKRWMEIATATFTSAQLQCKQQPPQTLGSIWPPQYVFGLDLGSNTCVAGRDVSLQQKLWYPAVLEGEKKPSWNWSQPLQENCSTDTIGVRRIFFPLHCLCRAIKATWTAKMVCFSAGRYVSSLTKVLWWSVRKETKWSQDAC